MHEDFWSFESSQLFVMLTNHKPIISGTAEGIWNRVRLVPWTVVIQEGERDPQLGDRIAAELPAVLARFAAGCTDYVRCGRSPPEPCSSARALAQKSLPTVPTESDRAGHSSPSRLMTKSGRPRSKMGAGGGMGRGYWRPAVPRLAACALGAAGMG